MWPNPQVPFPGPEPSGWWGRGGRREHAANTALHPKPQRPGQGEWGQPVTRGLFLNKGPRDPVTTGGLGGQGDKGPLLTNGQRAGQHRALALCCRGHCDGKVQVVSLCYALSWGQGRWATQLGHGRAQPTGPEVAQLGEASSLGRSGRAAGGCCSPPQEDTGSGWPQGSGGALDSGWVGGSRTVAGLVAAGAEASGPLPGGWARLGPQEITIITK